MLGKIFYDDKNYSANVNYANENGYTIKEIEADEIGRRFKIVEMEKPTERENLNTELNELLTWFDVFYTQHEQKYRRLHALGRLTDDEKDSYNELISLYNEAEIKRERIHEIEVLLNE